MIENIDPQLDYINQQKRRLARIQANGKITYYQRKKYEKEIFEALRLDMSMRNLERTINMINFELTSLINTC
jgi:hypothetical protein